MRSVKKLSLRPVTGGLAIAASAFAGVAVGAAWNDSAAGQTASPSVQSPAATVVARAGRHSSLADMVEAVGPSVVQIDASGGARTVATPYGYLQQPGRASLGSGFVIDPSGIVITNNHVVEGAEKVRVKLSDGTERSAQVLGSDRKTDLAVLRIEGGGRFQAVPWGDSDTVRVGESVFAVGSPFGLGNSVTSGIVSARGREIGAGPYDDFLQVDAAINSGNSGGPLFDANGRVVGVNTAIFSPTGGNVGIGFAIPARLAQSVARQIIADGKVARGQIGVGLQPLTGELAQALGLADTDGALIAQVEAGSPAAASGLVRGDVVRGFAERKVKDSREFARMIADAKPGTTIPVRVLRNGRSIALDLRIGRGEG